MSDSVRKRLVIVGGVAAGASAAAKARRMSERIEIVLLDAGPFISFANCGLPYYVGGEIQERNKLFVTDGDHFARRFKVDVRTNSRAVSIDPRRKIVEVESKEGRDTISYDRLILATGAEAVRPPIPGLDSAPIFSLRTVPDVDQITDFLDQLGLSRKETQRDSSSPRALVIGGGYIGLEAAEQLLRIGLKVTVVEQEEQVMLSLDPEMAFSIQQALISSGVDLVLGDRLEALEATSEGTVGRTASDREIGFDIGILSTGVRPSVELAKAAGLELGSTGAIHVDRFQRTSDPQIYAAGDNSEAPHLILGSAVNIPLAGPANKAGRIAGANAALDLLGKPDGDPRRLEFRGVLGTAGVRVCGEFAGVTGLTEKQARENSLDYEVIYMYGNSHAGYYPGAEILLMKVLFDPSTGKLLGAQVVGKEGVDKRIDVLATALTAGMTIDDLEHLDLCYAPPFGSAKDIEIMAGFAGANRRREIMPSLTPQELLTELASGNSVQVLDVRTAKEYSKGHLESAVNIPVDEIRQRLAEVPREKPLALYCGKGYRSYVAQQVLFENGWEDVRNILGGYSLISRIQEWRQSLLKEK